MTSKFSIPHPPIKPPSWCKSLKKDLPPLILPAGPDNWQGFAEWHDYGAAPPLHMAMYVTLTPVPGNGGWSGQQQFDDVLFKMFLTGSDPGSTWEIKLEVWRPGPWMEDHTFKPFLITTDPIWVSPLLTEPDPIVQDWSAAGVSA